MCTIKKRQPQNETVSYVYSATNVQQLLIFLWLEKEVLRKRN